jgi:hypothetical protein
MKEPDSKLDSKIILKTVYIATVVNDSEQNSHVRSYELATLLDELKIDRSNYKAIKDKLRHAETKNAGVVRASQTGIFFTHNGKEILFRKF